ncbi:MAG: MoaD/ThiS family protein [Candidatus Thorarchaeota archaeon]|nr:MoaD/ThiS family protein [Candidatus Thorarchaeota archaeon]
MAHVLVKFFATVREVTGVKSIELEAETIGDLLQSLVQTYGNKFKDTVLNNDTGELKQFFSCMINGRRIELLDGYETVLKDDDAVALFPPVGGG